MFLRTFATVKMKKYKITGVWFLISLLVFAITPKDIFHEFHEHAHEIEHVDLDCHKQHFETKHTHCPVLKQVAPLFYINAEIFSSLFAQYIALFDYPTKVFLKTPTHFMFGLKAPPYSISRVC